MTKSPLIALAGNPNSGKSTLFNYLTGDHAEIGNWAGVTVDSKVGMLKKSFAGGKTCRIMDLPGSYSISPYSPEEAIARAHILEQPIDCMINVADGANLSRSLFFSTQLLELGIPVVIAINKMDIIQKRGDSIDTEMLSCSLGAPVLIINAENPQGIEELMEVALSYRDVPRSSEILHDWERKKYVEQLVKDARRRSFEPSALSYSDRLDRFFIHPFYGFVAFFLIMWAVYAFSIEGLGGMLSDWLNERVFSEWMPQQLEAFALHFHLHPLLVEFINKAIFGGVGAVVGFLPLIMILFFCLSLLEDSGYMARVAVLMDKYFKRIGLSGKSIIPMIVGSGCAVPGVMATRTIEDPKARRITAMLTPFVPCSAKIPVIALFSMAFFPRSSWVGPSTYLLAVAVILLGGVLLKKIFGIKKRSHFIIELPEYSIPNLKRAFRKMIFQAKAFLMKAATIIFVMNTLIWFLQRFTPSLQLSEDPSLSILAKISGLLAVFLIPIGLHGWQLFAAFIAGFVAKENVVATMAVLFGASQDALSRSGGVLSQWFNPVTAYAFLLLNLFTPPCFAAIASIKGELQSWKNLGVTLAFQLSVGYLLAILVAQGGAMLLYGKLLASWPMALLVLLVYVLLVLFLVRRKAV